MSKSGDNSALASPHFAYSLVGQTDERVGKTRRVASRIINTAKALEYKGTKEMFSSIFARMRLTSLLLLLLCTVTVMGQECGRRKSRILKSRVSEESIFIPLGASR